MKELSRPTKLFVLAVIFIGWPMAVLQLPNLDWRFPWLWLLAGMASVAQILKVEGATVRSSYNISWLLYGLTFVLLGAPAAILVILIAHLVEWVWHKYPWYIQSFNIANYVIAVLLASWVYDSINPAGTPLRLEGALAILAALSVFTLVNHLLVGLVIKLARGQSFSESAVFSPLTLMIDYSLLGMGAIIALISIINPFATVLGLLPLYLIYSTLKVPALQRQTEIDPKTKVFNARYFADALEKELSRADRFDRPMTIVMGDLDLLRNINNTYGHLAGDVVLIGVAEILQNLTRDYDVVARFGGEEFSILMPETTSEEAFPIVEKIRKTVEAHEFEVSTSVTPIKATMSFGITSRDDIGQSASDLIHNADLALYHSKLNGRNLTCIFSEDAIDGLFEAADLSIPVKDEAALEARIEVSQSRFRPNELREKAATQKEGAITAATPKVKVVANPRPRWYLSVYIGAMVVVVASLLALLLPYQHHLAWLPLLAFAAIIVLTEALSVEIYVRDTSISTASIPLIAGSILFGPIGALVLSISLAGTAMIKRRTPPMRLAFNASNHAISSLLGTALAALTGLSYALGGFLTEGMIEPHLLVLTISVAAGFMSYLSSTLFLAGVLALDTGESFRSIWGERFRWLLPYYAVYGGIAASVIYGYVYVGLPGVLLILLTVFMLRVSQTQYIDHTKNIVTQLRTQNEELETHATEINTLNDELLQAFALVIDIRDPHVFGHSEQVERYAVAIARELGLLDKQIELIRKAALLHDIGKIGVAEEILFKRGPLTTGEYEQVKQHTILGAQIIRTVHSQRELEPIVRHHHERYDGAGYPDGIAGEEIPLEARIICLADSVEAMASDRPYRRALSKAKILREVQENAGTQFDPVVAKAFQRWVEREGIQVITNASRLGTGQLPELVEAMGELEPVPINYRRPPD